MKPVSETYTKRPADKLTGMSWWASGWCVWVFAQSQCLSALTISWRLAGGQPWEDWGQAHFLAGLWREYLHQSDPPPILAQTSSFAFSKYSLNIRKFTVDILLMPGLENFEHYLLAMWIMPLWIWIYRYLPDFLLSIFGIVYTWNWNCQIIWSFHV